MLVSLMMKARYHTIQLPEWRDGHFVVTDPVSGEELFDIVGDGIGWQLYPCGDTQLKDKVDRLSDGQLIRARVGSTLEKAILYVEKKKRQYAKYGRCSVSDNASFVIGTDANADIRLGSKVISGQHCVLACRNRQWSVKSLNQSIGVYVNGRHTMQTVLRPGDTVSVMNQKFIVLPGVLAMNGQNLLPESLRGKVVPIKFDEADTGRMVGKAPSPVFFHREPRFTNGLSGEDFDVIAPPTPVAQTARDPMLDHRGDSDGMMTYGPALVSGATMLLGGMANPVAAIGMLVSSILFPSLRKKKQQEALDLKREEDEKQRELEIQEEKKRREVYAQYLKKLDRELDELNVRQTKQLLKFNPSALEEAENLRRSRKSLWNRRSEHSDYLDIRLGTGDLPIRANVNFPDEAYISKGDPLLDSIRAVREKERPLRGVPIMLQLSRFYSVGVSGPRELTVPMIARMILQLSMHIGYDDLKLCILGKLPAELKKLKWLPHTWNDESTVHMIAEDKDELTALLPVLDNELIQHRSRNRGSDADLSSRVMVFLILDEELAGSGMVTRLLFDQPSDRVHVISTATHSRNLPQRTDLAIGLRTGKGRVLWQENEMRCSADFNPDPDVTAMIDPLVELMANTRLDLRQEMVRMPNVVPFMDMFGAQDIARLNIMSRWLRSDPIHSLAAPIGISEDGNLCMLDLHEKGDGPHGLVAGTTGSGKSEMLMNYILSMAVNYSPLEVSFVLIDYKGGGMAKAFENLPHTAGIITNLDGNAIKRSLQSIESELQRRQMIFSECQKKLGARNIDIYKYQQMYRDHKVSKPLSHLIVIADEFAELKTQQPDFLNKLNSAARIGRSLGVHLILATQRPGGIVDEQIRSNSNFRIALRVQNPADSRDVLQCDDAAYLTRVGSMFKQVGYGEVLIKAQSGWTGADYTPDRVSLPNAGVDVLNYMGGVLRHEDVSVGKSSGITQMEACIKYITDLGRTSNMHAHPLWQPVLEKKISLSALRDKYKVTDEPRVLRPVLGEADDPALQSRALLRLDFSSGKNTLLYGTSGSGKLMAVGTVLEDLLLRHNAEEMQIYIMDCADDGLGIYRQAPQVGDVLGSSDDEKLQRLLMMLEEQIRLRKQFLGGAVDGSPLSERLERAKLGHILVIIHHILVFQTITEVYEARFKNVMKEGPRYGISFFATQEASSGLRFKYDQEFSQKYTLQLDNGEYSNIVGRTEGFTPGAAIGRGMYRGPAPDNRLYEFQTATADQQPRELCESLAQSWTGPKAEPVRVLPDRVTVADLEGSLRPASPWRIPVALNIRTIRPEYFNFDSRLLHLALGRPRHLAKTFNGIAALAAKNGIRVIALDPDEWMDPVSNGENVGPDGLVEHIEKMWDFCLAVRRQMDNNETSEPGAPTLYLIPDIGAVMKCVDESDRRRGLEEKDSNRTGLENMLGKIREIWGWRFVVGGTSKTIQGLMYSDWFKNSASREDGMHFGNGITRDVLDFETFSGEVSGYPQGYIIREKEITKVQFVLEAGKGDWDEWKE